jgi:inorganic phosphate transporter, PiT family
MPEQSMAMFAFAVTLAYIYAFVGGFTDAANAIATSVGSRVLSPRAAVAMAGVFNLLGGLTGTAVAATIGKGLVDPDVLTLTTVVAGIAGAMSWSLVTYFFGIPVSETHGLIGGLIGAAVATAGVDVVNWSSHIRAGGRSNALRHYCMALSSRLSRTGHAVVRQPSTSIGRVHGV